MIAPLAGSPTVVPTGLPNSTQPTEGISAPSTYPHNADVVFVERMREPAVSVEEDAAAEFRQTEVKTGQVLPGQQVPELERMILVADGDECASVLGDS
jgi:hypothetical protein